LVFIDHFEDLGLGVPQIIGGSSRSVIVELGDLRCSSAIAWHAFAMLAMA